MVDYSGPTFLVFLAFVFLALMLLRGMNFEMIQGGFQLAISSLKIKKPKNLINQSSVDLNKSTSLPDWQHVTVFVHTYSRIAIIICFLLNCPFSNVVLGSLIHYSGPLYLDSLCKSSSKNTTTTTHQFIQFKSL